MNVEDWRRSVWLFLATIMSASQVGAAPDVFQVGRQVPALAAGALLENGATCTFAAVGEPLTLLEAVERALCGNPQTREAWASVKIQAAAVGASRAAYLPSVSGSLQGVHDESGTSVSDHPELSSNNRANVWTAAASLSWVLYDFGDREAAVRNATELLAATQANHQAVLQTVFAAVTRDYYAAQGAQGVVVASLEIERTANESADAASGRVDKGAAPISDALQARTALAQATFNRAKAEGDAQAAIGVLATDMNLPTDAPLKLPAVDEGVKADSDFDRSVSALMIEAERTHPSVLQADAQLRAAQAKVDQVRAQGLPSISLVAKSTRNNQPVAAAVGLPQYPSTGRDWSVGVQVSIPLFEGFGRSYQVRQAKAQVELQGAALDQAKSQVGLDVWTSYQALRTATQNLANSEQLLRLSQAAEHATQDRYAAGVGTIIELLTSQSALAAAKRQRLQALTDWRAARLQLAGKLGTLGLWRLGFEIDAYRSGKAS